MKPASGQPGPFTSRVYRGKVMHRRLFPFGHHFVYRVFSLCLDLDELPELDRRLKLFGHNRRALFSFQDRDHGARDGGPLRPWIEEQLHRAGIDLEGGSIELLCFPRIFGYVFNPLTVWFCRHRDGSLKALLYEVSNTFGEHHCYLLPVEGSWREGQPLHQSCSKGFYVSPFLPIAGDYRFRVLPPAERLSLGIRLTQPEGDQLVAVQTGERAALTDGMLAKLFFSYPLMTAKIMAAIHWEALRLWRKGATYFRRPAPPADLVEAPGADSGEDLRSHRFPEAAE
ncbi:DUF1365 domain-containing protein [Limibacillus halophilus]|jgi:DUF1365 family protein